MDHRAVLHRMEACGRESLRGTETARPRVADADPDERRIIAQLAEGGRHRTAAGELPRSWKAAGGGGGGQLSGRVPLCVGDATRRISSRRTGARTGHVAGATAALPSGAKRALD